MAIDTYPELVMKINFVYTGNVFVARWVSKFSENHLGKTFK